MNLMLNFNKFIWLPMKFAKFWNSRAKFWKHDHLAWSLSQIYLSVPSQSACVSLGFRQLFLFHTSLWLLYVGCCTRGLLESCPYPFLAPFCLGFHMFSGLFQWLSSFLCASLGLTFHLAWILLSWLSSLALFGRFLPYSVLSQFFYCIPPHWFL